VGGEADVLDSALFAELLSLVHTPARTHRPIKELLVVKSMQTKKFHVIQTPTTLVLDHTGRVTSRIGGAPKQSTIDQQLGSFAI
jgi:hypothetical protein